jgi:hypothetical protein
MFGYHIINLDIGIWQFLPFFFLDLSLLVISYWPKPLILEFFLGGKIFPLKKGCHEPSLAFFPNFVM